MDTTIVTEPAAVSPPKADPDRQGWFANTTAPFGLPDGTVRATIALGVIFSDLFMNCYGKWAPPVLDTWATVAFTYYFATAITRGEPGTRVMATVSKLLVATLLFTALPAHAAHFETDQVTLSQTPIPVGSDSGRALLTLKGVSGSMACGPVDRDVSDYYPIAANEVVTIGDGGGLWGGSTVEQIVMCVATNATPAVLALIEEGRMPERTSTPTNTFTLTHTPTVTPTFTNTPVPPTATDTPLPTATPTPTVPTATPTITETPII